MPCPKFDQTGPQGWDCCLSWSCSFLPVFIFYQMLLHQNQSDEPEEPFCSWVPRNWGAHLLDLWNDRQNPNTPEEKKSTETLSKEWSWKKSQFLHWHCELLTAFTTFLAKVRASGSASATPFLMAWGFKCQLRIDFQYRWNRPLAKLPHAFQGSA